MILIVEMVNMTLTMPKNLDRICLRFHLVLSKMQVKSNWIVENFLSPPNSV
jgi:hypothetical protein